jgi:hypothetical protein
MIANNAQYRQSCSIDMITYYTAHERETTDQISRSITIDNITSAGTSNSLDLRF